MTQSTERQRICDADCTSGCHSADCDHHGYAFDAVECDADCTSGCHADACEHHD